MSLLLVSFLNNCRLLSLVTIHIGQVSSPFTLQGAIDLLGLIVFQVYRSMHYPFSFHVEFYLDQLQYSTCVVHLRDMAVRQRDLWIIDYIPSEIQPSAVSFQHLFLVVCTLRSFKMNGGEGRCCTWCESSSYHVSLVIKAQSVIFR